MAAVPQFRFGPRIERRDNEVVHIFSNFVRWLQAVSGLGVFTSMTEIFTMMAAFCMLIYSILLFYNGSIEYLSSRIQPHPYITILKIISLTSSVLTIFGVLVSRRRYMRLVCLFYSAVSLLLTVQLYVAHILSTDPSHLENAASDAYVGSRNSINRQLGIASVNAYKPLALLCFFIELLAIFAVTCRQVFLAS